MAAGHEASYRDTKCECPSHSGFHCECRLHCQFECGQYEYECDCDRHNQVDNDKKALISSKNDPVSRSESNKTRTRTKTKKKGKPKTSHVEALVEARLVTSLANYLGQRNQSNVANEFLCHERNNININNISSLNKYNNNNDQNQNQNQNQPQYDSNNIKFKLYPSSRRRFRSRLFCYCIPSSSPILLAACFSLFMLLSLVILFGLSFHKHYLHDLESMFSKNVAHNANNKSKLAIINNMFEQEKRFEDMLTVQTECARLVGRVEPGANAGLSFTGIPFALAPVGRRRWARPEVLWNNSTYCDASKLLMLDEVSHKKQASSICAQLSPVTGRLLGHEDCLYLDVYTPQLSIATKKPLPVMVYVHGGFLTFGSGVGSASHSQDVDELELEDYQARSSSMELHQLERNLYSGHLRPSGSLATELNVVMVSFNYRLQSLGFLALQSLSEAGGPQSSQGNYGLWDQVAALEWVQRNIDPFSGDPNNVVIFGPDTGPSALTLSRLIYENNFRHNLAQPDISWLDISGRPLFRGAWLINPTLYYQTSAANFTLQHNELDLLEQRHQNKNKMNIKWSRSPPSNCLLQNCTVENEDEIENENENEKQNVSRCSNYAPENLVHCLRELNAFEASKIMLSHDHDAHPSNRLDEQMSLPVRSIRPNQFVVVDGELVQTAFPFHPTNKTISHAGHAKIDLLIGSSSQAADYWHNPKDIRNWKWSDLRHYVKTSLSTFGPNVFEQATKMYPELGLSSSGDNQTASGSIPAELYLTLVSDIKQLCPINQLVRQLRLLEYPVRRYVVDTRPREPTSRLAYHTIELEAFFGTQNAQGYESDIDRHDDQDPMNLLSHHIRKVVSDFVHRTQGTGNSDFVLSSLGHVDQIRGQEHKMNVCDFWHRQIGESYAWIS